MPERTFQVLDTETREARSEGELKALARDLELRLAESVERERDLGERLDSLEGEAISRERELREKVRKYMEFNQRVEGSRSWRILQFFRGIVGRKW